MEFGVYFVTFAEIYVKYITNSRLLQKEHAQHCDRVIRAQVYVDAPLAVAEERDPKGLSAT